MLHRTATQPAGFALAATALFAVGLLSALVDGTLGWEYLAQELLFRLTH